MALWATSGIAIAIWFFYALAAGDVNAREFALSLCFLWIFLLNLLVGRGGRPKPPSKPEPGLTP